MNFIEILLSSNLLSFRKQFLDFYCTFMLQASTACELPPIFVPEIDNDSGPVEQSAGDGKSFGRANEHSIQQTYLVNDHDVEFSSRQ